MFDRRLANRRARRRDGGQRARLLWDDQVCGKGLAGLQSESEECGEAESIRGAQRWMIESASRDDGENEVNAETCASTSAAEISPAEIVGSVRVQLRSAVAPNYDANPHGFACRAITANRINQ